jgi:hypothetical protein
MTDISTDMATGCKVRAPRRRPCIQLPDGDELVPRQQFASEIGITDRTARKLNLRTTFIGGVAYVPRNASKEQLAEGARRRNEPHVGRRSGRKTAT